MYLLATLGSNFQFLIMFHHLQFGLLITFGCLDDVSCSTLDNASSFAIFEHLIDTVYQTIGHQILTLVAKYLLGLYGVWRCIKKPAPAQNLHKVHWLTGSSTSLDNSGNLSDGFDISRFSNATTLWAPFHFTYLHVSLLFRGFLIGASFPH